MTTTIPVEVDADTARAYAAASPERQRNWQHILAVRLRELTESPAQSLFESMHAMSREAAANGLTPEILESILRDE